MILSNSRLLYWPRPAAVLIAVALMAATTSSAQAIIVRHDVDSAAYLQSDDAYPAVFDVFERRGGVATLVAPQWALTVGHVGQDVPPGHDVTIAGQKYVVKRVVLHPDWDTKHLEMALLKLDRPAQGIEPILPYENTDELGQIVTFVGRGDTGTGLTGPTTQDHKLRAATNRIERVEGGTLVFRLDAPGDESVTPLEGISGPGDSGGPALIETADWLRVAGLSVASSGRPKGRYGALEFYSRVSPQVTWIREITMPASAVEPVVTPVAAASNDVEPVESPASFPAVEADTIATPNPVPAREAGAEATSGSGTPVYATVAVLGGLALVTFAWWFRRRRPSVSA